ncbi:4-coumarate--CoA ligase 1 [Blomia tropicalis]|nr:4-coumarate--CoA ligase 1 [Blomia tropicalis]
MFALALVWVGLILVQLIIFNHKRTHNVNQQIKELIKYKLWTVAPSEIEAFLQTHTSIVGMKHETEGQNIRAYRFLLKIF